jgi:hypothetical protein
LQEVRPPTTKAGGQWSDERARVLQKPFRAKEPQHFFLTNDGLNRPKKTTEENACFGTNRRPHMSKYVMPRQAVKIQTKRITDWNSFHLVFAETMGFPDFYGRNMNAWIDCMSSVNDGMTRFTVAPGELFDLEIADTKDFAQRLPEIFQAFIESAAFVNWRRLENRESPILALILL